VPVERRSAYVECISQPAHRQAFHAALVEEPHRCGNDRIACDSAPPVGPLGTCPRVTELKQEPGGDILVTGSRTLWNSLLDQELVDELHLMIGGVVLAAGTPAFPTAVHASLRLQGLRKMTGSENFVTHYAIEKRGSE
jgi:RibD C-terminal domain